MAICETLCELIVLLRDLMRCRFSKGEFKFAVEIYSKQTLAHARIYDSFH